MNDLKAFEKIKKINMVVFDLDGTLLTSNQVLSKYSVLGIQELHKRGIKIVIASGRIYTMLETFINQLGCVDFVISTNGASIDDIKKGLPLKRLHIDEEDAKKLIFYCQNEKIECNILKREACYFPRDSKRIDRFLNYNIHAVSHEDQPIKIAFYDHDFNQYAKIEKLLINENNPVKAQQVMHFMDTHTKLRYTKSGKELIDVSDQKASKDQALKSLSEMLEIPLDTIVVFGDYDNDVEMMKIAGFSIAPQQASLKALKTANFITLSNDDEGIAYAIKILLEMGIIK